MIVLRSLPEVSTQRLPVHDSDQDLESGNTSSPSPAREPFEGTEVIRSFLLSYGTARRRSSSSPTPTHHSETHVSTISPHSPSIPRNNNEIHAYLRLKRIFTTVDLFTAFYRSPLPIPVWMAYFSQGPGADVLPLTYFCLKFINITYLLKAILEVVRNYSNGRTVSFSSLCTSNIHRNMVTTPLKQRSLEWTHKHAPSVSIISRNR